MKNTRFIPYLFISCLLVLAMGCKKDETEPKITIEIGDVSEGGIIFFIDSTGEHGKVCSETDWVLRWDKAKLNCSLSSEGGYTDWYLPSKEELKLMYTNLHLNGLGGFSNGNYWSSTTNGNLAWVQFFGNGFEDLRWKDISNHVRAVRAF